MAPEPRLIIASNRLPFSVRTEQGALKVEPTCGGLASALGAVHGRDRNVWIGWPGDSGSTRSAELEGWFDRHRIIPVDLDGTEIAGYYDGVCNAVLWPVLHYLIDRLPIVLPEFGTYRAVNQRFADLIVREYRDGDIVWVHDYHLMLVPGMVRGQLPGARIGFFLHVPFPAADVFRVLPWRRELLEGLAGATLIGFQTERDVTNFEDAVHTITNYRMAGQAIVTDGRAARIGAYPIGIDPARLPDRDLHVQDCGATGDDLALTGRTLFLGVDRLDYTKGIPRRLVAFQRLLEERPALHGRVELLQVAVPSRTHVPSYAALKSEVDALVNAINKRFGDASWTPVRSLSRALSAADLVRLYSAADVMLVTSLRDGMNLVAKEYVLTRKDEDGVLVLSEFAGAADDLDEALVVNPYSIEQLAGAMAQALELGREERRRRMRILRQRVACGTVDTWLSRFIADLTRGARGIAAVDRFVKAS